MRLLRLIALIASAWLVATPSGASPSDGLGLYSAQDARISVVTFGPGDHPFARFGHNALLVEDPRTGQGLVFNFGTFSFDSLSLVPRFLQGDLRYWLSVSSWRSTLEAYRRADRSIVVQRLNLSAEQTRKLVAALRVNALPENRSYAYHFYRDNCSTRVRDAIDQTIGGRLRALTAEQPARMSFREHTARMLAGDLALRLALDGALGPAVDVAITRNDELFLPEELQRALREIDVERDGERVPLVASERVLHHAERPATASAPPSPTLGMLALGGATAAVVLGLALLGRRSSGARRAYFAICTGIGALAGLLGLACLALWLLTDHTVAYRNANLLQVSPVGLALAGALLIRREGGAKRLLPLSGLLLMSSLAGLGLHLIGAEQKNLPFIALWLPIWGGVAAGALTLRRAAASRAAVGQAATGERQRTRGRSPISAPPA